MLHALLGGPKVSIDFLMNKLNVWELESDPTISPDTKNRNTSLSDTIGYTRICQLAAEDPSVLKRFKSEKNYMRILECVDYPLGKLYFEEICDDDQLILNLKRVSAFEVGKPLKYHYPLLGRISPTSLRYAKVSGDLKRLFGDLSGFSIAEIGAGNGGQSIQICNMFNIKEYTFFDLPEVQALIRAILAKNGFRFNAVYPDIFCLSDMKFDLLIANYSFSELDIRTQGEYLQKIIRSSKRGYMILNDIKPINFETLPGTELQSLIPHSMLIPEVPQSHPSNQLLIWGHDD
jgi:hypothetical protein